MSFFIVLSVNNIKLEVLKLKIATAYHNKAFSDFSLFHFKNILRLNFEK